MASIPLVALQYRNPEQPDFLRQQAEATALRNQQEQAQFERQQRPLQMQQQQLQVQQQQNAVQSGNLDIAARQQAQKDQAIIGQLWAQHGGDIRKVEESLPQSGVSPQGMASWTKEIEGIRANIAKTDKDQLDAMQAANKQLAPIAQSIVEAQPEDQAALYSIAVNKIKRDPVLAKYAADLPAQYPGPDFLKQHLSMMKTIEQLSSDRTFQAEHGPLSQAQIDAENQANTVAWQQRNPKQPLPDALMLKPGATKEDAARQAQAFGRVQTAQNQVLQAQATAAQRGMTNAIALSASDERSYQHSISQLEAQAKPVRDLAQRLGRLQDTLAQGSPQADALVAPELLSVMAGGQGSGLRMNEAEIKRIVGGRSNWEGLQAAANQWRLDPSKANTITPAQRQQIRALTDAVAQKLMQKQQIYDTARQQLAGTNDQKERRKIVTNANSSALSVDTKGQGLAGPIQPGETTAVGPGNHTIVVREGKWVDPQTGQPLQ